MSHFPYKSHTSPVKRIPAGILSDSSRAYVTVHSRLCNQSSCNDGATDLNFEQSSGEQIGSNNYPHQYNNFEGFDFRVSGPWQEFPLTRGGYTGGEYLIPTRSVNPETSADYGFAGSPGADRVVFNQNCDYAGSITHTGASGNNFVGCSDTS